MKQKKYQSVTSVLTLLFLGSPSLVASASTSGGGEKAAAAAMQASSTDAAPHRPRSSSHQHRPRDASAAGSTASPRRAPPTTTPAPAPATSRKRSSSSKAAPSTSANTTAREGSLQVSATSTTVSPGQSRTPSPGPVADLLQKVQTALQPKASTTTPPPATPSPGKPPASRRLSRDGKHHPRQSIFSEAFQGWVSVHAPKTVEDAWRAGLLGQPHEYAHHPHHLVTAAQRGPLSEEHHVAGTYHLAHALRQVFNKEFKLTGADFTTVQHLFHFSRALTHIQGSEVTEDARRAEAEIRNHNPFLGALMDTWTQITQHVQQAASE